MNTHLADYIVGAVILIGSLVVAIISVVSVIREQNRREKEWRAKDAVYFARLREYLNAGEEQK